MGCLFVPFRDFTSYVGVVTGSHVTVNHWLWIFDSRKVIASPLLRWAQVHQMQIDEKEQFRFHDTFALGSAIYADGFNRTPMDSFDFDLQEIYTERESETAIRHFLVSMMTAPDEVTRGQCMLQARARAEALKATVQ